MVQLLICWFSFLHPLHVSVTEIKFDPKDKELEIVSRIFIDELEEAVRKEVNKPSLDLLNPGTDATIDQLVSQYLSGRLKISVDGKAAKIKYLGHEIEGDAMIVYAYAPAVKKLSAIEVYHSTITELYDDQSNLVHVTVGEQTKSLRLMRDSLTGKLLFNK
jgi:hypothetical protein